MRDKQVADLEPRHELTLVIDPLQIACIPAPPAIRQPGSATMQQWQVCRRQQLMGPMNTQKLD
jgi:hypothetical protein